MSEAHNSAIRILNDALELINNRAIRYAGRPDIEESLRTAVKFLSDEADRVKIEKHDAEFGRVAPISGVVTGGGAKAFATCFQRELGNLTDARTR